MKLSSFILVLCCILPLVFADDKCNCEHTVANCDQLPQCGKPIVRNKTSCESYKKADKTKIAECNKIHFSTNLNNTLGCPDGTKAWPLTFIWNITYDDFAFDDNSTRPVYKINDKFPNPTIHAIKGDWVLIPVINKIKKPNDKGKCGELTTIHWHGITMRTVDRWDGNIVPGTPFMDGVPGINQCPIPGCDKQGNRLDYFFQFVDSGTYWYHSHYGTQIADGLAGSIVVKDCDDRDRFRYLNDGKTYDEPDDWDITTIAVSDWSNNTTAEEEFEKYRYSTIKPNASTIIIDPTDNRTVYEIPVEPEPNTAIINGKTKFKLKVTRGNIYRLRLINMSAMALFTFRIDGHTFEVIEVEGMLVNRNNDTEPLEELKINSGQRYSILVNANQPGNVYGMHFYTFGCHRNTSFSQNITGTILYDGDDVAAPLPKVPKTYECTDLPMNTLIPYCDFTNNSLCKKPPKNNGNLYNINIIMDTLLYNISKINDTDPWEQNVVGYLSHDFNTYWDHKWSNVKNNTFLEVLKLTKKPKSWDPTLNVYSLNEPKVHDILFNNIDEVNHPIHLHGHFFYVLGFGTTLSNYNNDSDYSLNEDNPIQRDTITVPKKGWAQIRFIVNNPGVWPMHCHYDWHLGVGMLAQFVELARSNVTQTYINNNDNKPPKEWCDACTDAENAKSYCKKPE